MLIFLEQTMLPTKSYLIQLMVKKLHQKYNKICLIISLIYHFEKIVNLSLSLKFALFDI